VDQTIQSFEIVTMLGMSCSRKVRCDLCSVASPHTACDPMMSILRMTARVGARHLNPPKLTLYLFGLSICTLLVTSSYSTCHELFVDMSIYARGTATSQYVHSQCARTVKLILRKVHEGNDSN
jgi:hypothetical protein